MEITHTHEYGGDAEDYTGSGMPYTRNHEKAYYSTIAGTARLIEMQRKGKKIPDEEIEKGIKENVEKLGITEEEYREKLSMLTDPKPENKPELNKETDTSTSEGGPLQL